MSQSEIINQAEIINEHTKNIQGYLEAIALTFDCNNKPTKSMVLNSIASINHNLTIIKEIINNEVVIRNEVQR